MAQEKKKATRWISRSFMTTTSSRTRLVLCPSQFLVEGHLFSNILFKHFDHCEVKDYVDVFYIGYNKFKYSFCYYII
jgi:hypothetical protein